MARKRDLFRQIREIKKRLPQGKGRSEAVNRRLSALIGAVEQTFGPQELLPAEAIGELKRNFSIAVVACIEGYFRLLIEDLLKIPRFRRNAIEQFQKGDVTIKLDPQDILAMEDENITPGAIFSRALRLSKLSDVVSHMTKILGVPFWDFLKDSDGRAVKKQYPQLYHKLEQLFQNRHILAHELATEWNLGDPEVMSMVTAGIWFIILCDANMLDVERAERSLTASCRTSPETGSDTVSISDT